MVSSPDSWGRRSFAHTTALRDSLVLYCISHHRSTSWVDHCRAESSRHLYDSESRSLVPDQVSTNSVRSGARRKLTPMRPEHWLSHQCQATQCAPTLCCNHCSMSRTPACQACDCCGEVLGHGTEARYSNCGGSISIMTLIFSHGHDSSGAVASDSVGGIAGSERLRLDHGNDVAGTADVAGGL